MNAPLPNLPLHLMLTLGCWLSSPFALRCAKSALPPSNTAANPPADEAKLAEALGREAKNRASQLLSGLLRYAETPYARSVAEPPSIWRQGNARLLDYGALAPSGAAGRPVVLFVPSLINRYYILDLEEERSMLRYLSAQGLYPLVLDWGRPGEAESGYACEAYILRILLPALEFLVRSSGQGVVLAGYCMGGVLCAAAARLRPGCVAGLALLATPWDFHCPEFAPFMLAESWQPVLRSLLGDDRELPADRVQSLFYLTDPWVFEQKFRRFAGMAAGSRAARDFVALEHWVNDGIPMTGGVARECLLDWAQSNSLARGQWKVAGRRIDPGRLTMPAFIAIPRNDHVVPYACAAPLAEAVPQAHVMHPGAGHVGMIVGGQAKRELWQPFARWVADLVPD